MCPWRREILTFTEPSGEVTSFSVSERGCLPPRNHSKKRCFILAISILYIICIFFSRFLSSFLKAKMI